MVLLLVMVSFIWFWDWSRFVLDASVVVGSFRLVSGGSSWYYS